MKCKECSKDMCQIRNNVYQCGQCCDIIVVLKSQKRQELRPKTKISNFGFNKLINKIDKVLSDLDKK